MQAEPLPRLVGLVTGLVVGLLVLTACSDGASLPLDPPRTRSAANDLPEVTSYVALGDSFTSAPFVPATDLAEGCLRSDGNYPSLLAQELEPERFVDVSCSAAGTADVTGPQATAGGRGTVPPQLRAVTADTDLVTVGIGANDEQVFFRLARGCATSEGAAQCSSLLEAAAPALGRMRGNVAGVLRRVKRRAPDATVVLVGYPRLSAPERPCARLPVPDDLLDELAAFEVRLNRALRGAARDAGTAYVDMYASSVGHEICSEEPWVNGNVTDASKALAYHPFAAGQRGVATQVLEVLRRESR